MRWSKVSKYYNVALACYWLSDDASEGGLSASWQWLTAGWNYGKWNDG